MGSEWILGRLAEGEGVEWIQLAQDRDRWPALVNTVMNLWLSFQALILRSLFMKNTVKLPLELSSIFLDGISFVQWTQDMHVHLLTSSLLFQPQFLN
jgi:hypothetical protein